MQFIYDSDLTVDQEQKINREKVTAATRNILNKL